MFVYYVTVQVPTSNKYEIDVLYKEFGTNIPLFLELEGGDGNGCLYIICIKNDVLYETLIKKYDFIIYKSIMEKIEDMQYNSNYKVRLPSGMNWSNKYALTEIKESEKKISDKELREMEERAGKELREMEEGVVERERKRQRVCVREPETERVEKTHRERERDEIDEARYWGLHGENNII